MYKVPVDNVTEVTAASSEPISLATAKSHLRVDVSDDDTLIGTLITAARQHCEKYCNRSFAIRTLRADLPGFVDDVLLPFGPVIAVESVKYWDTASPSVQQTWASSNYQLFYDQVERMYGISFESVYPRPDAVQITYRAGYTTSSPETNDTPSAVNQAILLLVGDMYENREAQIVGTITSENRAMKMLLDPYRKYQ